MTTSRIFFALIAAAGLASAQEAITVKVDGVATCQVQAWAFGASDPGPAVGSAGAAAGRPQVSPLVLTRQLDQCSPKLFSFTTTGNHIKTVELIQYADATMRAQVMDVVLTDALVSNYQLTGNAGSPTPAESVAFSYSKIEFRYFQPNGAQIVVGYDVKAAKSF